MSRGRCLISGALLVLFLGCSLGCGTISVLKLKYEGYQLANTGHYPEATVKLEQGLEQARKSKNILLEINSVNKRIISAFLSNLGWVYSAMGQYDRALEYYQQALAIDREIKRGRRFEAGGLSALGGLYADLGQYDRALEYKQQALAINKEAKDCFLQGGLLSSLGGHYSRMGQYDKAREYYQQALAVHRAFCIQPFNRPFEWRHRGGEAGDLSGLACIHMSLGQYDQAREYGEQALAIERKIKNRSGQGSDLNNLGIIYRHLGQYDRAREALEEGLKIAHETGRRESLWRAQAILGDLEVKVANYEPAIQRYRQSLDTIEGLRAGLADKENRTTFMQNKLHVYDALIDVLRVLHEKDPTKGYDRDALEIFERKQGRMFLEEIGKSGARNFAGLPEEVKNRETELENRRSNLQVALEKERTKSQPDPARLHTLESEFEQARTNLVALQTELRTNYPDYYALKYPQPVKLSELKTKVLKPDEILMVYGVMHDKTCLWVIGKGVFRLQTLPVGEKDLAQKVATYRRLILKTGDEEGKEARPQDATKEARDKLRQELYNLLIPDQVRAALVPGSRLYIVPTGPLYSLPSEALETQAPGQPPHYLVQDHAIAYLSSASLLKTLRDARARKQTQPPYPLLAVANPSYGKDSQGQAEDGSIRGLRTRAYKDILRGGFMDLPETEDEVRAIKAVLQAPEASNPLQVREAASRSTVLSLNQAGKLTAYRYLVFACHGVLPGEVSQVVQPALVLSHPEKEGFLTMGDIFGL
ncbi:MAG: CHAT domain-containing tetratricopeptide repeat protein, partial [Deltaproteobacteria bacterium]|nr:CHAT domain-containing tetratricopeptide repeat protein [Deltaproteobacteria bacterium]